MQAQKTPIADFAREQAHLRSLPECSAEEVVRRQPRNLEVAAGVTHVIAPGSKGADEQLYRVCLRRYEDLQQLGFVPRGLPEDRVRRAVEADDHEVRELLRHGGPAKTCSCPPANNPKRQAAQVEPSPAQQFARLRRSHHPALSGVLAEHLGVPMRWDAPLLKRVHAWMDRIAYHFEVVVLPMQDIIIEKNAKLVIGASVTSLLARTILIHDTGELVSQGGYLRIWADTIEPLGSLQSLRLQLENVQVAPWIKN